MTTYFLKAILCHRGNVLRNGHYVTYMKGSSFDEWVCCDDTKVTVMTNEEAKPELDSSAFLILFTISDLDHVLDNFTLAPCLENVGEK